MCSDLADNAEIVIKMYACENILFILQLHTGYEK